MKKGCPVKNTRRDFLKTSTAAAAGIIIPKAPLLKPLLSGMEWYEGMPINTAIDNLRVVCCYDANMVSGTMATTVEGQNACINRKLVHGNMDEMAKRLANKNNAMEAWSTIFQKPPSKEWKEVKVAIKVNCLNTTIMPRAAIIEKAAIALNSLGVPFPNIVIYDGCSGASGGKYDTLRAKQYLPQGIIVSAANDSLGGITDAPVPAPFSGSFACTKFIADGTIDILINCAVNKGHGPEFGNCTLTMKNHFGTFTPNPKGHGTIEYLFAINKSNAIVGGTPPRQQLCIMDSIFASDSGPSDAPNKKPYRILMGVFGPALDYVTCIEIRKKVMGNSESTVWKRFLTEFGYQNSDISNLTIITVPPVVAGLDDEKNVQPAQLKRIELIISSKRFHSTVESIFIDGTDGITNAGITDIKGRIVKTLPLRNLPQNRRCTFVWDATDSAGVSVCPGMYIFFIQGRGFKKSTTIIIH